MDDNFLKLVDIAYNMHTSGRYDEAKNVYEKLLSIKPDDIEVLNLYAQLSMQLKNYDTALNIFNNLYEKTQLDSIQLNIAKIYMLKEDYKSVISSIKMISDQDINSLRLLSSAYRKSGNNKEAIKVYEDIMKNQKHFFTDLFNLSILYSKENDKENALKTAIEAYSINNTDIDINIHLSSLYEFFSDWQNALKHLLIISKINPEKSILYRIGVMYKKLNEDELAVKYFNDILNIEPGNKEALINIAQIYKNHDKNVSAKIFKELCEKYPDDKGLLLMHYTLYENMMKYEKCLEISSKMLALEPDNSLYSSINGDTLYELYRYDEAVEMYKKSIELSDGDTLYENLKVAEIYAITGKKEEALKILSKYPKEVAEGEYYMYIKLRDKKLNEVRETFYNYVSESHGESYVDDRALRLFYKLGIDKKYSIDQNTFSLFKNKTDNSMVKRREMYMKKEWKTTCNDIKGKRLLIYNVNGAGDLIMFCRYIKDLEKTASEIILQVPNPFVDLFKYNFPGCKIYSNKEDIDENSYDVTTFFMCLLYDLNIDLNNIDGSVYLKADEKWVKEKASLDIMKTKKKKIGIYWQGNPAILRNRSIKLKIWQPLFELDNVQIYSFQISTLDFASDELKHEYPLIDLAEHIKSYADTAAFLKNIDLLITIDTSIANLAGAMGIKTYLLLPFKTEWRWFYDTETTPWYNSVRIFKQKIPGDWDEVIARVKHELTI